jgi:hypothetical protein
VINTCPSSWLHFLFVQSLRDGERQRRVPQTFIYTRRSSGQTTHPAEDALKREASARKRAASNRMKAQEIRLSKDKAAELSKHTSKPSTNDGIDEVTLTFGRHTKKTVAQVWAENPDYITKFLLKRNEEDGSAHFAGFAAVLKGNNSAPSRPLWEALKSLASRPEAHFNELRSLIAKLEAHYHRPQGSFSVCGKRLRHGTNKPHISLHPTMRTDLNPSKEASAAVQQMRAKYFHEEDVLFVSSEALHGTWKVSTGEFASVNGRTVTFCDVSSNLFRGGCTATVLELPCDNEAGQKLMIGEWSITSSSHSYLRWENLDGNRRTLNVVTWERRPPPESIAVLLSSMRKGEESIAHASAAAVAAAPPSIGVNEALRSGLSQSQRQKKQLESNKNNFEKPKRCPFCTHKKFFKSKNGLLYHQKGCKAALDAQGPTKSSRQQQKFGLEKHFNGGLVKITFSAVAARNRASGELNDRSRLRLLSLLLIRRVFTGERTELVNKHEEEEKEDENATPVGALKDAASVLRVGLIRHIAEYVWGNGVGCLHQLKGSLYRTGDHGAADALQIDFESAIKTEIRTGAFRSWGSLLRLPPLPVLQSRSEQNSACSGKTRSPLKFSRM